MDLPISEFSEICRLSPQTLRFYHAKGLLVPAGVNEQTGYRYYRFEQVAQAMLVTVLRQTGMSVRLVRRAVEEPDVAAVLLREHAAETQRQRQLQDEAVSDALELLTSWPEPRRSHAPRATVVSKPEPDGGSAEVVRAVESCGAVVSGTPWRTWAPEGHWLVTVPISDAVADLPTSVFEARDELSIVVPGRDSMAKLGTAISYLLSYPLDDGVVDMSEMRQIMHAGGVETAMAIRGGAPDTGLVAERFTARAQAVVAAGRAEASAAGHERVGTGHLVLGLGVRTRGDAVLPAGRYNVVDQGCVVHPGRPGPPDPPRSPDPPR